MTELKELRIPVNGEVGVTTSSVLIEVMAQVNELIRREKAREALDAITLEEAMDEFMGPIFGYPPR